eukprot:scaffold116850_cov31-Prasinocladus_malaysianus.AAC.2
MAGKFNVHVKGQHQRTDLQRCSPGGMQSNNHPGRGSPVDSLQLSLQPLVLCTAGREVCVAAKEDEMHHSGNSAEEVRVLPRESSQAK